MSRVGKKPIAIPAGVTVTISNDKLEVKGPKGTLSTPVPAGVSFKQEDGSLVAERASKDEAAFHGLARALANNAVVGGSLVPLEQVWYYIVGGFVVLGFVLCGLGTATSIRKHLNV